MAMPVSIAADIPAHEYLNRQESNYLYHISHQEAEIRYICKTTIKGGAYV